MGDNRNYAALEWVTGEIAETLKQARQALEAYEKDADDPTRMRFCLTHIHQVHGTLQIVEFYGAALLAEEMEKLAQAMVHGKIEHVSEAQEVLMRCILQLPVYLERIKRSRNDDPLQLLPLLNDIRSVIGESYLTETSLFSPDLELAEVPEAKTGLTDKEDPNFLQLMRKLRQMYQISLIGYIRGQQVEKNLAYVLKVSSRLETISKGTPHEPLWQIVVAVLDGVEQGIIAPSVALKNLLRQVDDEFKLIAKEGRQGLNHKPSEDLIKNLLYFIARCEGSSDKVEAVRKRYNLKASLPADAAADAAGTDPEALGSVVEVLKEELESIKDVLELHARNPSGTMADLQDLMPVFKRVADTMGVLGIGALRKDVVHQSERVQRLAEGSTEDVATELMSIAEDIIATELALDELPGAQSHVAASSGSPISTSNRHLGEAQETVIRESRNGLEHAKEAVNEYISSQWQLEHLQGVPTLLQEISGGLAMVPMPRAAAVLDQCAAFVRRELLIKKQKPEWAILDTLADAITSVEYYLERIADDSESEGQMILDVAEESVARLGMSAFQQRTRETLETEAVDVEPAEAAAEIADTPVDEAAPIVEPPILATEAVAESASENLASEPVAEPEPVAQTTPVVVDDDEDMVDEEIVEIFVEEAGEVLETIDEYLPRWRRDFADEESLAELRRAFHTLKGSGRLVGAMLLGELAWSIESLLNKLMEKTLPTTDARCEIVELVRQKVPELVDDFSHGRSRAHADDIQALQVRADLLASADANDVQPLAAEAVVDQAVADADAVEAVAESSEQPELLADSLEIDGEEYLIHTELSQDAVLWGIFCNEAESHLGIVEQFLAEANDWLPSEIMPGDNVQRALHTLKGSAFMAEVEAIAKAITPVEKFIKELRLYQLKATPAVLQLLSDSIALVRRGLVDLAEDHRAQLSGSDEVMAQVEVLHDALIMPQLAQSTPEPQSQVDPQLMQLFISDEMEVLLEAGGILAEYADTLQSDSLVALIAGLSKLEVAAGNAGLVPVAQVCGQLAQLYELWGVTGLGVDESGLGCANAAHECLIDLMDLAAADQNLLNEQTQPQLEQTSAQLAEVLENTYNLAEQATAPEPVVEDIVEDNVEAVVENVAATTESVVVTPQELTPSDDLATDTDTPVADETLQEVAELTPTGDTEISVAAELEQQGAPAQAVASATLLARIEQDFSGGDIDVEILEIFLEEASELLESIDEAIHDWVEEPNSEALLEDLQRLLHTLKGGSRLATMMTLADLSHDFETLLTDPVVTAQRDAAFFTRIERYQDQLAKVLDAIKAKVSGGDVDTGALSETMATTPEPSAVPATETADILPFKAPSTAAEPTINVPSNIPSSVAVALHEHAGIEADASRRGPQEVVKISSELLEELVNLAGETSISRARIEEQIAEFGFSLEEMDITLSRVQEQLRRLAIETEAQILFRQEQVESEGIENFDPLEMDRYSQLQQLSRSLVESSSDLQDLKNTLSEKSRDAETLLLQQGRINTELQEGLMRSRMVPFSRMVPRLRRIIRQVGNELDKQINLDLGNIEGELDRSVLERMVAPLEHMLRNAIDHGIEAAADRRAVGKSEVGTIRLDITREGGDILISLADDGRGINLEAVRNKAIERGLMDPAARLTEYEILQFILQSGFSTATSVTQISGRGVGMDVVHSEIKQLGGSMTIHSTQGKGAEFRIRLPFTVSVNRALMVRLGEENYAVPLNTIEGIVRVSCFELEAYYQPDAPLFEYAGQQYSMKYMGELLQNGQTPKLQGALSLPVLLVRGAEHAIAIQVDGIIGSREIVVKSLGPQFSQVQGLSGATVLGDGSVVVILDLHALMRSNAALAQREETLIVQEEVKQTTTVMVVDDSVTVRKVTSRFLEREGMEVILAKDGADAMLKLQENIPDVMLLDIEMPRMDGFEVASSMRANPQFKDIPIIMITSRTGDKHRKRAMDMGVNRFLGKPYQEAELLETIGELVEIHTV